ncbi:MAG: hypothetical protein WC119_01775 [Synergistaceae bacterium]
MKASRILQNLRSELIQFSESVSQDVIAKRIRHIAMDFEAEFVKWIKGNGAKKDLTDLKAPIVLDTLRFLETIKESHPDGVSKPNFVKYFVGTSNSKYLPVILSLSEIFKSSGSIILEPYSDILEHTDIFGAESASDTALIGTDLRKIENVFRQHTEGLINKPFKGEGGGVKTKLSKNDKKKELFFYLIDNVSADIAKSLDSFGFDVVADQIRSDRLFLIKPQSLKSSRLVGPERDRTYQVLQAEKLAKDILRQIEPEDNEYNYNLLVNTAMRFSMAMSDDDYDMYFYNLKMQQAQGNLAEIPRASFGQRDWLNPTFITFIAFTLMFIMAQVKF